MSIAAWAGAILGIGSAYSSYKAGKNEAAAAEAEAAYNIAASEVEIGSLKRSIDVQLRNIHDIKASQQIGREAAKHIAATAGIHKERAGVLNERAGLVDKQAGILREEAGLIRKQAALTRESVGMIRHRAALATKAAGAIEAGMEATMFNIEAQKRFSLEALMEGRLSAEEVRFETERVVGLTEAGAAARGVAVGEGSAEQLTASVTMLGRREEAKVLRAAARQSLGHDVQVKNLEASLEGQEVDRESQLATANELGLKARQTALGAEQQLLSAKSRELDADNQILAAKSLRLDAKDAANAYKAQLLRAAEYEQNVNAMDTRVAQAQLGVANTATQIDSLKTRKALYATMGKLGARGANLQGISGAVTALGQTATNFWLSKQ